MPGFRITNVAEWTYLPEVRNDLIISSPGPVFVIKCLIERLYFYIRQSAHAVRSNMY